MSVGNVSPSFLIRCKGRDKFGKEVLGVPVDVSVLVYRPSDDDSLICSRVSCVHNRGCHHESCASSGEWVPCAYVFTIPLETSQVYHGQTTDK